MTSREPTLASSPEPALPRLADASADTAWAAAVERAAEEGYQACRYEATDDTALHMRGLFEDFRGQLRERRAARAAQDPTAA